MTLVWYIVCVACSELTFIAGYLMGCLVGALATMAYEVLLRRALVNVFAAALEGAMAVFFGSMSAAAVAILIGRSAGIEDGLTILLAGMLPVICEFQDFGCRFRAAHTNEVYRIGWPGRLHSAMKAFPEIGAYKMALSEIAASERADRQDPQVQEKAARFAVWYLGWMARARLMVLRR